MMCIVMMMMMMINVLFYISITRETSSCTSRKGGWLMKSLSLKMSRDETRKTKFKFTKSAEKLFLTTRTRTMMMMCTTLPLLLLKLLRFLNRFCSSFFSSSSSLVSSSVLLLLLLLRVVVGVFPSSSAFSFAVSLPSRLSVLRKKSYSTKAREEKSLSKILSSFFLSLSRNARANASAVWWVKQSPKTRNSPNSKPWTV